MKFWKSVLKGIAFLAFAGLAFFGVMQLAKHYILKDTAKQQSEEEATPSPAAKKRTSSINLTDALNQNNVLAYTDNSAVELREEIDLENIVERVLPSTVSIECNVRTTDFFGQTVMARTAGSGIYLENSENVLYLVTNQHVIDGATSIEVTFADGESYPCELKNADSVYDIAILTIKAQALKESTMKSIVPATLAEAGNVQVGNMAVAIGNAEGYGTSVTVGFISATDHKYGENSVISLIQTDAAINPGNSGGALVNTDGEVIGITSSKLTSTNVEGMGFAIPIKVALPIIRDLQIKENIPEDEQGYLGIYITSISSDEAQILNWPAGIYVKEIIEGGAASESDLMVGDIIVAVNDVPVFTTEQLQARVTSYRFGTTITLTVKRLNNGSFEEYEIKVTLKEKSL